MREYDRAPCAAFELDDRQDTRAPREEPARWPGKRTALDAGTLYRSAAGTGTPGKVSRTSLEAMAARSQGDRLPAALQGRLERRLGTDLSAVRVHTGSEAAESAAGVDARAYAVGNDIYFGAGSYDPGSRAGQRLIAHEVAHTVQQQGASTSGELDVSSPADAHEQEADAFAESFSTDPVVDEPRRVLTPDEGPRLVRPVQLARVSRVVIARDPLPEPGAGSRAPRAPDGTPVQPGPGAKPIPPSGGPSAKSKEDTIIRLPDEMLFPGWYDEPKPNKLLSKQFTLAEGAATVFGIPLTYGVKAHLDVEQGYKAFFGPGMLHNIALKKTDEDRLDEPLTPISDWWKDSPTARAKQRHHSATATATAAGGVGAWITAEAAGSVEGSLGFEAVKGKVKVGLKGTAGASATGELEADSKLSIYYDGGLPHVSGSLSAALGYSWYYSLSPFIDAELTVQPPKIPIVTDLYNEVSGWPVVRWFAPKLDDLKWTTHWRKEWTPIKHQGGMQSKKLFILNVSGVAPNPVAYTLSTPAYQPMEDVTQKALDAPPASEEIPKEVADEKRQVVGHDHAATASAREKALAKIAVARTALARERNWGANALTRLRKAIDAAKVKQAKEEEAAKAKGGPQLATVDPIPKPGAPIPGTGGKKGPVAELEAKEDVVEKRDSEVKSAEKVADRLEESVKKVQAQAEGGTGRQRSEASETHEKMGQNADILTDEATGEGKETPKPGHVHLKRPAMGDVSDSGVTPVASKAEAEVEKKRTSAFQAMRRAEEHVTEELLWAVEEIANIGNNTDLKEYEGRVRARHGDYAWLQQSLKSAEILIQRQQTRGLDAEADAYDQALRRVEDINQERARLGGRPIQTWDTEFTELINGQFLLKTEYAGKVRKSFYDFKYGPGAKDWKLDALETKVIDGIEYWKYTGAKSPAPRNNEWWELDEKNKVERPTIDHSEESVARHWNRIGRLHGPDSRRLYYSGYSDNTQGGVMLDDPGSHLRLVPQSLNSILGNTSDRVKYRRDVGLHFKAREGLLKKK